MTRHARNSTAGAVYTYHEKQKDGKESGYGSTSKRLGKDSLRNFDCCCLTLQPCKNPVITKEGYLYDKEAILQYIITKKNEITRKIKEYEKQQKSEANELKALADAERSDRVKTFVKQESNITLPSATPGRSTKSGNETSSISNMAPGKEGHVPSFWIPSKTPQAKSTLMKEPDKTVYCPMTGNPIKLKDLTDVKFTEIKDTSDKKSLIAKEARYMCPITRDTLSNSVPCAVIRTTGDVVTMDCVEKIISKDWLHPLNGQKLTKKDIIPLQRGATGFASTNQGLEAKESRPALQV